MIDPHGESTRATLLARLADQGPDQAWRAFDRRYGDLIVRYACRKGVCFTDADDVRQVTYMILMEVMKRFEYDRERGRFRSYLALVVHRAIGRCKQRSLGTPLEKILLEPITADDPNDSIWEEEWTRTQLGLAADRVRETISHQSLCIFDDLLRGLTTEAICLNRGCSRDTVYKIRRRVSDRLAVEARVIRDEEDELARSLCHAARFS